MILTIICIVIIAVFLTWALPDPFNRRYAREIKNRMPQPLYYHSGSPTSLEFREDGKVYNRVTGKEVKAVPLKQLLRDKK